MIISTESKDGKNLYAISMSLMFSIFLQYLVTTVFGYKVFNVISIVIVLVMSFLFSALYILLDIIKDYIRYEFRVRKSQELYKKRINVFAFGDIFQLFKKQSNGEFYTYTNIFHYLIVNYRTKELLDMQDRLKILSKSDIKTIYSFKYLNIFTLSILVNIIGYTTLGVLTAYSDNILALMYAGIIFYCIYFYYCIIISRKYEQLRISLFSKGLTQFSYDKKTFI